MRRRRPERGRGRRVLAWAAMGFVAATVAAGALIDAAPLDVRFPELDRALRGVDRAKGRLAVVFHGSSRFQAGIRPEVIEPTLRRATGDASLRVVSGAVAAGDPISGELFVREMIARGHRPTILVQEISPETVSSSPFMSFHLARQFTWADIATALPDI
jgi:hypothetical protein